LYKWKGVDTIVAAKFKGQIYLVGGTKQDLEKYRKRVGKNVHVVGHVKPSKVPKYQKAADVVILPTPAKYKISKHYTSPLKLFEYMASKTPILASNVPSNKEILNSKNAVFFKPDSPTSFANNLNWMLSNNKKCAARAAQAYKDVKNYTWDKRARNILKFLLKT